ncbi:hypothetical protein EMGBS15_00770 [Filimonas sp.]|nr:hypothetical protein EMGBS15_00770 [Filimonas sp.]
MGILNSKSIFQFTSKSDIIKIVLTVTIVFVLLQFIRISMLLQSNSDADFYTYLWNKMSIPSDLKTFIRQPWSLFTYFFLDTGSWGGLWNIVANLIWLWIFGTVIEDLRGPNRILPIFVIGGIVGGLFMLIFGLIKQTPPQLFTGASTCVMAVAFAAVFFKPSYKFWALFGVGIPIWVLLMLFVGLKMVSIQLYNIPSLFLLLGGLTVGLLYNNVLSGFFEKCTELLRRSGNLLDNKNFVLNKEPKVRNRTTQQMPFKHVQMSLNKIDEILDKINERGIQSLTKEERRLLDDYSNHKKDN